MPSTLNTCRIFIASPGETGEEALCVENVCENLNKRPLIKEKKILLDPMNWEDAVPRAGDAGEIINLLAADCDILVCLFHRQMDLPGDTAREVFSRAYDRWKEKKKPAILLYFKQMNIASIEDMNDPQLCKVLEFKKTITEERLALFKEVQTPEEFSRMLTIHLESYTREFTPGTEAPSPPVPLVIKAELPGVYKRYIIEHCKFMDIDSLRTDSKTLQLRLPEVYVPYIYGQACPGNYS